MKPQELPVAVPPNGPAAHWTSGYAGVAHRIVDRFTYPAEKPFVTLLLYYALLLGAGAAAIYWIPGASEMISGARLRELAAGGQTITGLVQDTDPWFIWRVNISMALAMIGSFLLMLPTSWVYMAERRRKGFDQSVVRTVLILAVAVSGVVVIARNSLALAFSLAGVVGAVRFRNVLPDTRDTLYVLVAIGVGLAAGVDALAAAAVLSMVFNFIALLLWKHDYGSCELGTNPGHLLVGADAQSNGDKKRPKDFNAVLLVRAHDASKARTAVEPILSTEVRRYKLVEMETTSKGKGVLKYLIRMGKNVEAAHLEDALLLRAAPNVIGARIH